MLLAWPGVCMPVHMPSHVYRSQTQRSEENVQDLVLSFYHAVLGNELKPSGLEARAFLFSLSRFAGPWARLILREKHQMTCKM